MASSEVTVNGTGPCMLLFITFLVLKLCDVITWSWWWVTAPLWGGVALFVLFAGLAILFAYKQHKKIQSNWLKNR